METLEETDVYLTEFARFEHRTNGHGGAGMTRLRKAGIARFSELGFPTVNDEEWRFTNLAPMAKIPFQLAEADPELPHRHDLRVLADSPGAIRFRFLNGHPIAAYTHDEPPPQGVIVSTLAEALAKHSSLVERHLARYARYQDCAFAALNTAFLQDGVFVYLPRGFVLEKPIHVVYQSHVTGEPTVSHPRNLIVAEEGSRATVIECFVGTEDHVYFTNAVTEIVAGPNAIVDHYKLQEESKEAFHIGTIQIQQDRGSNVATHAISLGATIGRNDINAVLDAEGCECTLNGLYMAGDGQLLDSHTRIDHAKAHCTSHELYKGILTGKGRGVFNGKIYVHPDAQKTDAKQTNQTLLLSDDAIIDSKPQLEIFADDVKCTHGATIGQLDEECIFYLRSRGIDREAARSLLTYAFANDIISRIKVEPIRAQLEEVLLAQQRLPLNREAT